MDANNDLRDKLEHVQALARDIRTYDDVPGVVVIPGPTGEPMIRVLNENGSLTDYVTDADFMALDHRLTAAREALDARVDAIMAELYS